tara:strand:+ start:39 stop:479 length:441 start_codon:yes stop_codon:yes gene_type:complete
MTKAMRDRLGKVAAALSARKKAKKPVAARGKTTRREAGRRAMKQMVETLGMRSNAIKDRIGAMSPGKLRAVTGKTAIGKKMGPQAVARRKAIQTMGMSPGTAAMNKAAMTFAKKIKPSGRLSTDDIKKATAMLKRAAAGAQGKKGK